MIGQLILRLFHARTAAHILHLKSRSYAQHVALNSFYDEIIPLADAIAETYQGDYGLIEDYDVAFVLPSDAVNYLDNLCDWIEKNRKSFWDQRDTHLNNILDEVVALVRSTQYKLRFLK